MKMIDKEKLIDEIERRIKERDFQMKSGCWVSSTYIYEDLLDYIDTLEVKDPYEQCVQFDSIKAAIQFHAETYSFNIESKLFNQLTKEQQELWRREIEEACINGADAGYYLAKDTRYKENSEVDLEKEIELTKGDYEQVDVAWNNDFDFIARHFFELGLKAKEGKK